MSKIIFVPLTDEMVFDHPDIITGPITAYQPVVSKKNNRCVSPSNSIQDSGIYLKGDLLNGLDVVYIGDQPTRSIKPERYRGFTRGNSFG